jgi:acetyl esterase/lipase
MEVTVLRDIPFTAEPHPQTQLDLYLPKTPDQPPPLIVYIHGGAWVDRDKKGTSQFLFSSICSSLNSECTDYEHLGRLWASQGVAVAVINYRLSPKEKNASPQHPIHTFTSTCTFFFLETTKH